MPSHSAPKRAHFVRLALAFALALALLCIAVFLITRSGKPSARVADGSRPMPVRGSDPVGTSSAVTSPSGMSPLKRTGTTDWIDVSVLRLGEQPEPRASVVLTCEGRRYGEPDFKVSTTTDDAGLARVLIPAEWPAGSVSAWAVSSRGDRISSPATASRGEHVCLLLEHRAWTIAGRVTGCSTASLFGAHIRAYCSLWPEAPFNIRLVEVTRDGTFRITGVAGFVGLTANAPGCVPSARWSATVSSDVEDIDLCVGPPARPVEVRLVDDHDSPLPEGTVLRYQSAQRGVLVARLETNGKAVLPTVHPAEDLTLWLDAVPDGDGRWRTAETSVIVTPDRFDRPIVIAVPPASRVEFELKDVAGQPIANATLVLEAETAHEAVQRIVGKSDPDGRWAPLRRRPRLFGRSRLWLHGQLVWRGDLSSSRSAPDVITLAERWTSISVRLTDTSGRAIASRNISVAVVDPQYAAIPDVDDPFRGSRIPFYEFEEPSVLIAIPERLLASARLSVLELSHAERLLPIPARATEVTVSPSADSGTLVIISEQLESAVLEMRSVDRRQFTFGVKKGMTRGYGLPPGEYEWEVRCDGRANRGGIAQIDAGRTTEIIVP